MLSHPNMLYKSDCYGRHHKIVCAPTSTSTPWWWFGSAAVTHSLIHRPIMNLLHKPLHVKDMFRAAAG